MARDDLHTTALDTFCDHPVGSLQRSDPVQSEHRGDLCPEAAAGVGGRHAYSPADDYGFSHADTEHSALRLGSLRFNRNLHAPTGRDDDRVLGGYRALALRVLAGRSALPSRRRSRLVLPGSGPAAIRTVPPAGLARRPASG